MKKSNTMLMNTLKKYEISLNLKKKKKMKFPSNIGILAVLENKFQ